MLLRTWIQRTFRLRMHGHNNPVVAKRPTRALIVASLLALLAIIQLSMMIESYALPMLKRVWATRTYSAPVRSGYAVYGPEFADYLTFVRENVPDDARILLSPHEFSNRDLMGFFLIPRQVLQCREGTEAEACLAEMADSNTYVLALGDFPQDGWVHQSHSFIAFERAEGELRGVFAPKRDQQEAPANAASSASPSAAILLPAFIIVMSIALGISALTHVTDQLRLAWVLGLAFPLGAGLLAWVLFLLSWIGLPISAYSVLAVASIMLATSYLRRRWVRNGMGGRSEGLNKPTSDVHRQEPMAGSAKVILTILLLLFVSSGIIGIGTSYARWDPIAIWGIKGYGIGVEGTIFAAEDWGEHGLAYMSNIPMQIGLFWIAGSDPLPMSKAIFALYYASLLAVCYAFWRDTGLSTKLAGLGALFIATVPLIFEHSTAGFTNLPLTYYLVAGVLVGIISLRRKRMTYLALSGLLLGLAAWTRVEGTLYVAMALIVLLVAGRGDRMSISGRVALVVPVVLVGGGWLLFYVAGGAENSQSLKALERIGAVLPIGIEDFVPVRVMLAHVKRMFWEPDTWGLAFPASGAFLVVGIWLTRGLQDRSLKLLAATLFLFSLGPIVLFYVGSLGQSPEFLVGWVERGFSRAMFPAAILLLLVSITALGVLPGDNHQESVNSSG